MNKDKAFWLLTISIVAILLIPSLMQDGMFVDGVTYSAISRNLSQGIGNFCTPQYTKTCHTSFYDHPPLVFGIEAFFFRIMGDSIYTERFYILLTCVLSISGIILCWRLINKEYSWVPVLLWITVPEILWSYRNNLLENTVNVFTIFSVYFITRALTKRNFLLIIPASLLIVMAFLSKGFVGTFPLVTAVLFSLVFTRDSRNVLIALTTVILPLVMILSLFLIFPELRNNVKCYINHQLIPALQEKREVTSNNHFKIIFLLLTELICPLLILIFISIKERKFLKSIPIETKKLSLYFFLIGLSASIPLVITLKQRTFYLVPSICYFIISMSLIIVPFIASLVKTLPQSVFRFVKGIALGIFSFTILISAFKLGKYSRDEELIKDIYVIAENVPRASIIKMTEADRSNWPLIAYMNRIGNFSLDCDNEHEYLLINKSYPVDSGRLTNFLKVDLKLKRFVLLKRKKELNALQQKQL